MPVDDVLFRALIGALGIGAVAGALGVFVVWRRMAFLSATLAHTALLGVALGLVLGIDPNLGVFVVCAVVAVLLVALGRREHTSNDALLSILAHAGLAFGIIAMAFIGEEDAVADHERFVSFLFGDVLAITVSDVILIYGVGAAVMTALVYLWRPLLIMTVNEELAQVEGVRVTAVNLALVLLMAIMVALAMKVVGLLLVASLTVIPAATARRFSTTPEHMVVGASVVGCVAVVTGMWGATAFDAPPGPSIVAAAVLFFIVAGFAGTFRQPR